MKNISILLILLCFSVTTSYAQNDTTFSQTAVDIDPRIREVFSDQLQTLVLNVPNRLDDLNDILQNRVKIEKLKWEKDEKYTKLSSVKLFNKYNNNLFRDTNFIQGNFNPLKYEMNLHSRTILVYRIDNTENVVVIYPQTVLQNK